VLIEDIYSRIEPKRLRAQEDHLRGGDQLKCDQSNFLLILRIGKNVSEQGQDKLSYFLIPL
jgi:hypothetical protein